MTPPVPKSSHSHTDIPVPLQGIILNQAIIENVAGRIGDQNIYSRNFPKKAGRITSDLTKVRVDTTLCPHIFICMQLVPPEAIKRQGKFVIIDTAYSDAVAECIQQCPPAAVAYEHKLDGVRRFIIRKNPLEKKRKPADIPEHVQRMRLAFDIANAGWVSLPRWWKQVWITAWIWAKCDPIIKHRGICTSPKDFWMKVNIPTAFNTGELNYWPPKHGGHGKAYSYETWLSAGTHHPNVVRTTVKIQSFEWDSLEQDFATVEEFQDYLKDNFAPHPVDDSELAIATSWTTKDPPQCADWPPGAPPESQTPYTWQITFNGIQNCGGGTGASLNGITIELTQHDGAACWWHITKAITTPGGPVDYQFHIQLGDVGGDKTLTLWAFVDGGNDAFSATVNQVEWDPTTGFAGVANWITADQCAANPGSWDGHSGTMTGWPAKHKINTFRTFVRFGIANLLDADTLPNALTMNYKRLHFPDLNIHVVEDGILNWTAGAQNMMIWRSTDDAPFNDGFTLKTMTQPKIWDRWNLFPHLEAWFKTQPADAYIYIGPTGMPEEIPAPEEIDKTVYHKTQPEDPHDGTITVAYGWVNSTVAGGIGRITALTPQKIFKTFAHSPKAWWYKTKAHPRQPKRGQPQPPDAGYGFLLMAGIGYLSNFFTEIHDPRGRQSFPAAAYFIQSLPMTARDPTKKLETIRAVLDHFQIITKKHPDGHITWPA